MVFDGFQFLCARPCLEPYPLDFQILNQHETKCHTVNMTDNDPWNLMEVHISHVSTRPPSIESARYKLISNTDGLPCTNNDDQAPGLVVFNHMNMMQGMISSVKIATSYFERDVSVACIGAHDHPFASHYKP
jgi:hypothetical protein